MLLLILACLCATMVTAQNPQLPQLVNAQGGMTGVDGGGSYGNYYSPQASPYANAAQMLPQAATDFKQGASGVAQSLRGAGESLASVPRNFVDSVGNQVSSTFDNALQAGLDKLKDMRSQLAEKFRPLISAAVEVFQQPGNEKEHWSKVKKSRSTRQPLRYNITCSLSSVSRRPASANRRSKSSTSASPMPPCHRLTADDSHDVCSMRDLFALLLNPPLVLISTYS